jgi:DtxR family transcriptional regulator, Mn-dependent transcriptional regulator
MSESSHHARGRRRSDEHEPTDKMREYLEVIYYLASRKEPVISARLAEWMQVTPPTVANMVKEMEKRGYITRDSRNEITLTDNGFDVAEAMVRRHRILERFLVDVMGLPWHQLHEEAVQLEHGLTATMEARIEALVGSSLTCPHGNPIPGNLSTYPGTKSLNEATVGAPFTILRIAEEAEEDSDLIRYFQSNDLVPGARFEVVDQSPSFGVVLRNDGQTLTVPPHITRMVWGDPE